MFERILIAVDGSACSRRAARYGFALARAYDATVEAVHVLEADTDERRDRGEKILASASELGADVGVDVSTHLAAGDPAAGIVDRIAETGADLVVVGEHGRGGLGERLLGSVAERVLRRSDVPVLAVPDTDPGTDDVTVERVLATTDGSDAAERAAPVAADVAARVGATLHVLGVADVGAAGGVFGAGGVTDEFVERLEEQTRSHVESFAATAGAEDVTEAVVRGTAHSAIEAYTVEEEIDLLVMASQGTSDLAGHLLGSVTDRVLRVVGVPVLVVPV